MEINAIQASFNLDHIAIESSNPKKLSKFYKEIMQMDLQLYNNKDLICIGPSRKLIIVKGKKNKFSYAGFVCRNLECLEAFRTFVIKRSVEILDFDNPYLKMGSFSVQDPDGNIISFGLSSNEKQNLNNHFYGPLQHLTFASKNVENFQQFYSDKLGFKISDTVVHVDGSLATCFVTSNHEHHTVACFKSKNSGIDHHSYEVRDWNLIRDWCDHFSNKDVKLIWGPGRHGPGNNLFVFIEDIDKNWIELSAELEIIHDRKKKEWPQKEKTLNLWGKAIMRS